MSPDKPLELRHLKKEFGTVAALQGVSFSVERGEVFGYLGPNGAGKTTTLRIVLGLVRPSGGNAFIFGKSPSVASGRNDIGFLPGDLRLYGNMTVLAILDFFARFRWGAPPVLRDSLIDALALDRSTILLYCCSTSRPTASIRLYNMPSVKSSEASRSAAIRYYFRHTCCRRSNKSAGVWRS